MRRWLFMFTLAGAGLLLDAYGADMSVQLTTTDGSTNLSIQNSSGTQVASIDSLGNGSFNAITSSAQSFVANQSSQQIGAVLNLSSGTIDTFNTTSIRFGDGSIQTTASLGGGAILGVLPGYGLGGGNLLGIVTLNLSPNVTDYIQNRSTLQAGATFYVSSGTVTNLNTGQLKFSDGSTLTSGSNLGTITGVTAGSGLSGGGASGNVTLSLLSNSTSYIQNSGELQSGATVYVSSVTATNINTSALKFSDGSTQTTASAGGTISGVAAGYGLLGGGVSGNVTLSLLPNSTGYIQSSNALQSGATFYVSSGTATSFNTTTLKFADGTTQTTAAQGGTISAVTAGYGLSGGGSSGSVAVSLSPNVTFYIQNGSILQVGTTFYVSSATVTNLNTSQLKFSDGSTLTSGSSLGTITGVTAGSGLSGGGVSGGVTISLLPNSTSYIQNSSVLQSGATVYVSSVTATNINTNALKFSDGSTQTTASAGGTITSITVGSGLVGGGSSGAVTVSLSPNSTSYIQNSTTLQTGTTLYVSSATINNLNVVHIGGVGGTPSITIGSAAGSGSVALTGTDSDGQMSLTTGSLISLGTGVLLTVTFSQAYATAPYVVFSASNDNASSAATVVYVQTATTTFTLNARLALSLGSTTYRWHYHVAQ